MKRLLTLLLLITLFLGANAQISRSFWGVTLGRSSKQQVKTMLVQKGYRINIEPDGSYAVNANNVAFGGATWSYISFCFVGNILSEVWFQNNEKQSPVNINHVFEKLSKSLYGKYARFHLETTSDEYVEKCSDFSDGRTSLSLSIQSYHSLRYVSLSYGDENLSKKKRRNEYDEL